jgi:hypothetical protein
MNLFLFPETYNEGAGMRAIGEVQNDSADRYLVGFFAMHPVVWLAFGGLLSVAWVCALALWSYNMICWIVG